MTDTIDQRLIAELQKDGRATYAELAKKLGITPSTVAKKIDRLVTSKVIHIRALHNPFKLGLVANALIAIKTDPSKIDDVCDQLVDNLNVNSVMTVFGDFDVLIMVFFQQFDMLDNFINDELSRIDGILQFETYHIKEVKKRSQQIFESGSKYQSEQKLKDIDWRLIKELIKDGRVNVSDLAEKLQTHASTVSRRISALVGENIIKIQAVPNPSKLGYSSNAILILNIEPNKVDQICAYLLPFQEIHLLISMIYRSGLILGIHDASNESLYKFIKENIARISGITDIKTFVRAEIKKRYYAWYLTEKRP
jgi:Lrp/AsnC family transcriptional regulator for asnA, asnC and gidA